MSFESRVHLAVINHETGGGDIASSIRVTAANYALPYSDGTATSQAQVAWSDERTISNGGVDDLDLESLADDRGTVVLTAVKAVFIKNTHATNDLLIGASSAGVLPVTPWLGAPVQHNGDGHAVGPGGVVFGAYPSGYVIAGDSKVLRLAAAGASQTVTYQIILAGNGSVT